MQQEVAKSHSENIELILSFLKTNKVSDKELQTSRMEFGENIIYKNRENIKDGFFASSNISFKIRDLGKYKTLWLGLSKIKNITINNISYNHSNRIFFQNETRKKALLAAKEKAITLTETLGSKIGKPLLIEEQKNYIQHYRNSSINVSGSNGSSNNDIALGKIPITITIKVAFQLITPVK